MADDTSAGANMTHFTAGEAKFLLCALKHAENGFKFDSDAVAAELGYKDGSIARVRWNAINRTKIQGASASPNGGVQKRTANKKNTPKKAKAGGGTGGGSDDEEEATPTKTPKKRARKSKAETGVKEEVEIKKEEMENAIETTEKGDEDELEV